MKKLVILTLASASLLAGCTQLSAQDRAAISSAQQSADEAKQAAMMASEEARKAAMAAQQAADRADRIFRESQKK